MSKIKYNVAWNTTGGRVNIAIVPEEEKEQYEFFTGLKVMVKDNTILSNHTKGIISGFSCSSSGNILAHVDWLEGAPPLRIRLDKLHIDQPRKVWMLVQRNESIREGIGFSTGSAYFNNARGIYERRYFNLEDAQARARVLAREYGHDVLILQSVAVCNTGGETRTIK